MFELRNAISYYVCIVIVDVDECVSNISGCNQNCTNTIGSYFCSCNPGYEFGDHNRTCGGKGEALCLILRIPGIEVITHISCYFVDINECASSIQLQEYNKTCVGKKIYSIEMNAIFAAILDVDECTVIMNGCNQNCTNTNGSFFCSCQNGHELQNDNKTCIGKCMFIRIFFSLYVFILFYYYSSNNCS